MCVCVCVCITYRNEHYWYVRYKAVVTQSPSNRKGTEGKSGDDADRCMRRFDKNYLGERI